jgi:sporulation protein YlmC with PRC-barrel domain
MAADATTKMHTLDQSDLEVGDPAQDVRGRTVIDRIGQDIGTVDDLVIDDAEKRVRFLQIASGGFLGVGETKFMLPVDAITHITDEAVRVDQTREHVAGSPPYDPARTDRRYWAEVYSYFGYPPYWSPGYVYPGHPYYRY